MSIDTFKKLSKIDVGKHIEKKNNLSYLSWAWAWQTFCENVEKPSIKVYENEYGVNYWNDGRTAWVKVGVIDGDDEHIEYLPIMDFKNKSIPLNSITSFEVNKAIQRAATKAIARHGLGLYIYAGEDFPSEDDGKNEVPNKMPPPSKATDPEKKQAWADFSSICDNMEVDAIEFLSSQVEDATDKTAVYATVRKWLGNEQMLRDQLIVFKQS